jgi:hypothetical protein
VSWPCPLTILVGVLAVYLYLSPPADLDYCWQIRTGEVILRTGEIPPRDTFSYTLAGKRLPDHEWLYEVGLALWYHWLGDPGLRWLRLVLFVAPLVVLAWQLKKRGVAAHGIALTLWVCTLIFLSFERLRPMVFTTLGLQLAAGWIDDHVRGRKPLDVRLPLVMLLWGNLHPGVITGQALLIGAIASEWLSYFRGLTDRSMVRSLSIWAGLGLAATFVAPDPIGRLLYPFAPELRHPAQQLFREIRPPWDSPGRPPFVAEFALCLALLFAWVLWVKRYHYRLWEWGLLLGVTLLAATATRAMIDWLVIASAWAVPHLGPLLRDRVQQRRRLARFVLRWERLMKRIVAGPYFKPQVGWLAIMLIALGIFTISPWSARIPEYENPRWPQAAADAIASGVLPSEPPRNIFSGSDEGAYLIWRFPTQARVYSDTRGFYYPGEFLMDSYYLPAADAEWPRRFERVVAYRTEYFLLPVTCRWWSLLEQHGARPLHRDEQYVLLTTTEVEAAVESWKRQVELASRP